MGLPLNACPLLSLLKRGNFRTKRENSISRREPVWYMAQQDSSVERMEMNNKDHLSGQARGYGFKVVVIRVHQSV